MRFLILPLVFMLAFGCKEDCTPVKSTRNNPRSNAVEKNIYFSQDTIIAIKNSKDTISFYRSSITPTTYELATQTPSMGDCPNGEYINPLTIFPLNYVSLDKQDSIIITRDFYTDYNSTIHEDMYKYLVDGISYSYTGLYSIYPVVRDTILLKSNEYFPVIKLDNYQNRITYGYLYLDETGKIVRSIKTQNNDTLDFIY